MRRQQHGQDWPIERQRGRPRYEPAARAAQPRVQRIARTARAYQCGARRAGIRRAEADLQAIIDTGRAWALATSPALPRTRGAVCFGRGAQHLFTFEPGTLSEEVTTPHCLSSSPLCITVSRKSGLDSPDSVERARYFPSDGQAALATTASMPDWRCVGEVKPLYRRPCPDSLSARLSERANPREQPVKPRCLEPSCGDVPRGLATAEAQ
jgi:hypothetical protein